MTSLDALDTKYLFWGVELKDVALLAASIPVGYFLNWFFFRRGSSRKQIVYSMKVQDLLFKGEQYPAQLNITYGDEPIDILTKAEIYLWNGGNQPIAADDLNTTDRLRIAWPDDFKALDYSVRYQTRATNKVLIGSDATISFAYLNVNDGMIIDVVGARTSGQRLDITKDYGSVAGEIIGAVERPKRESFAFSVKRNYVVMMLFGFGMPMALGYRSYSDDFSFFQDFRWYDVPAALLIGLLVAGLLLLGFTGVYVWLKGNRVPVNMIALNQRSMTWKERLRVYFGVD